MKEKLFHYTAKVVRVIDGDTVVVDIDLGFDCWLKNQHVRLYGINAPESRTKNLEEKARGIKSKEYLRSIIIPGDTIILKTFLDKLGKFGRVLGVLYFRGMNLNEDMVTSGNAVDYFGGKR